MVDIINKNMSISKASEMLERHQIDTPWGWEVVIRMPLSECDYLEVHGYGDGAYFTKKMN